MTVSEHLEQTSFAYDPQFPPDVAAGQPLAMARRSRPAHQPAAKRAWRACTKALSRKR
jgi:hypothetical protein